MRWSVARSQGHFPPPSSPGAQSSSIMQIPETCYAFLSTAGQEDKENLGIVQTLNFIFWLIEQQTKLASLFIICEHFLQ